MHVESLYFQLIMGFLRHKAMVSQGASVLSCD